MANDSKNGWGEYRKYVLDKLESVDGKLDTITDKQIEILSRMNTFNIKSLLMGALGGAIVFILLVLGMSLEGVLKIVNILK